MECIECGKNEGEYHGLCPQCYITHYAKMDSPKYVNLTICPHCGALKRGEHWNNMDEPEMAVDISVKEALIFSPEVEYVNVELEIAEETPFVYHAHVYAELNTKGQVVEKEAEVIARIVSRVCDVCSRLHGNYYESIVQLRAYDSKLSKEQKEEWIGVAKDIIGSMAKKNRQVFLSKSVDIHGGLDFFISTTDAGRNLARELAKKTGATQKESAKIAGQKDGRDLYRTTFSVRLPPYSIGDYILLDKSLYRVEKVNKDRVELLLLRDGSIVKKKREVDPHIRIMGGGEITQEAVVVFEGEDEVQLMDPVTYKTMPTKKPAHYEKGETVCVIRYEEELYIA